MHPSTKRTGRLRRLRSKLLTVAALVSMSASLGVSCTSTERPPSATSAPASSTSPSTSVTSSSASTAPPGAPTTVPAPREMVWAPGHYLIVNTAESGNGSDSADKVTQLLKSPDGRRFTGVQVKLLWRDMEPEMDHYDFGVLDSVLDAAASAPGCTAGDGSAAPCRVLLQIQYKTSSPAVPAVPNYLLSTGEFCEANAGVCGIPADPAQRSPEQKTFCAPGGAQRCGAHEFPVISSGGESLAMMWLPGVEARFAKLLSALQSHVLSSSNAQTLAAYALPETTFEADPSPDGVLMTDEGYTQESYTAALERNWSAAHSNDPSRVVFQFVGNMPPISRKDLDSWSTMVRGFYTYAAEHPGLGIGHPDVAPTLGPTTGSPPRTVNPAVVAMTDPKLYTVPRNPSAQAPDVKADRTSGLRESWDLMVNKARGNYIAWTTSTRDAIYTWHDVAAKIATTPLPSANLAPPP